MDKKKLIEQIQNMKKTQTKSYFLCIKEIVNKYPDYYKDKDYAEYFKINRDIND